MVKTGGNNLAGALIEEISYREFYFLDVTFFNEQMVHYEGSLNVQF